jgi:hydrogenase/urease accessory protein HupE
MEAQELECGPSGLVGIVEFPWLEGTVTRVLVDIQWLGGARLLRVLTASTPSLLVYGIPDSSGYLGLTPIVRDYTWLGVEHILGGFDHLMFVVALTLLVRKRAALIATITAFTLAHSITLAATVLDLVRVPAPPVEAAIALSIVLVCAECARPGDSLTRRAPWLVAFAFGLLHGLGFASALLELGLPERHVPAALLCFNLGVELGQLATIAVVSGLSWLGGRVHAERPWLGRALVYAMGGVAGYWALERTLSVFQG